MVLRFDINVQVRFETLADESVERRQIGLQVGDDVRLAVALPRRFGVGFIEERIVVVGDRLVEGIRRV